MVPHLRTAHHLAISDLERKLLDATPAIERWFRLQWQEHTPPFYSSVDLRYAGLKLAPVDTNLFPGGFSYLAPEMYPLATQACLAAIEKYCPDAKSLLIIPENHHCGEYLKNLAHLGKIFGLTGLDVRFGSFSEEITQPTRISINEKDSILIEPLERQGRRITLDHGSFDPCTILLNNDLSAGHPIILENLKEQFLLPPLHAGWTIRRKSNHFAAYDEMVKKFAKQFDIDPWLINALHTTVHHVDFQKNQGIDEIATQVTSLLKKIAKKYREYGITEKPYVFIKADAGTYGLGVMKVSSVSELKDLSALQRQQMSTIKEGLAVHDVLIQEGVPTVENVSGSSAEPVVYMVDRYVVGGFYRVNPNRDHTENLSDEGMQFESMSFITEQERLNSEDERGSRNRFYQYGVIGRLAMLAAAIELEKTDPYAEVF